jgi:hypothetical protein
MATPDRPVFTPGRISERESYTYFLELQGTLAESRPLGELHLLDAYAIGCHFDPDRRLLACVMPEGSLSLFSLNDPEIPPKDVLKLDLGLGPIEHVAIGSLYEHEVTAAVVTAAKPGEVALVSLTDGGQYRKPEVMNVLGAPGNLEIPERQAVTSVALRNDRSGAEMAIAYGPDFIVHNIGARPGRGIMTDREREANREDLERMSLELHGRPYSDFETEKPDHDWLNVYRQRCRASWHGRLPHGQTVRRLAYQGFGSGIEYLTVTGSRQAFTAGVDYEHVAFGERHTGPDVPYRAKLGESFPIPAGSFAVSLGEPQDVLVAARWELTHRYVGVGQDAEASRLKLAAGFEVSDVRSDGRHLVIAGRAGHGQGGTVTVLDRYPHWS